MLVSYQWLNEYMDLSEVTPQELADKMSVTGIEVENVHVPADGLKKIVAGHVTECVPHPDSDHLSVCQVDIGEAELSQIVCGAPNVAAGQNVIVALPGSRIAGNVKIKKGKMRGQVSNGMICSLEELGYDNSLVPKEYAEGIYVLPEDAAIGEEVFSILGMDDALIELSITPNRADALSMHGVAYEVGAIYQKKPIFPVKELSETGADVHDLLKVNVLSTSDAPTYQMRIISGVKIQPSPLWLQNKLMNAGIRPINNVVDVTNYVLLEYGQPMHAFDFDQIGSGEIIVRRGKADELLTTLDGEERKVDEDDLLITNGEVALGLAGVMGGLDSEITDQTTTVALEAAVFDPKLIRKTSQKFNLRSESSSRFEKGINRGSVKEACDFAAAWIASLAGGTVAKGMITASETLPEERHVQTTIEHLEKAIGIALDEPIVSGIFKALDFPFTVIDGTYDVIIPPRRWDITIEADLTEEVARLYGLDRLPVSLPKGESLPGALTPMQRFTRKVRTLMEGAGLSEAVSYVLTTESKAVQYNDRKASPVHLKWPMTEDHSVLRQNLISGLLDDAAYNVARKNNHVALYEIGRGFFLQDNAIQPDEITFLGGLLTGHWALKDWQTLDAPVDFYTAKGVIEHLFTHLGLTDAVTYEATAGMPEMHPGRTAHILLNDEVIGFIGAIHPKEQKNYGLKETYVFQLELSALFAAEQRGVHYQAVTKFPSMKRDMALLVDETVTSQSLVQAIQKSGGRFLTSVVLFDVYQGDHLPKGKKSMAYTLTFQNNEATLVEEEVNQAVEKITKSLTELFAVEVR